MSKSSGENFFDEPKQELDEPFDCNRIKNDLSEIPIQERDKQRKEKRYFSAYKLLFFSLIVLLIIYGSDFILGLLKIEIVRDRTNNIIEIFKTVIFTLSGYLFAKNGSD